MNIYKCFRTGAKQSKHNMCGSRNIYQGGGIQIRRQENSLDSVFFVLLVLCSPLPINRGVPMVLFQRGSVIFQGVQLFRGMGGPNVNFYRNPYITCDFIPPPPLDPRLHNNLYSSCSSLLNATKFATDRICLFCWL